jgi:hypothetical protein
MTVVSAVEVGTILTRFALFRLAAWGVRGWTSSD